MAGLDEALEEARDDAEARVRSVGAALQNVTSRPGTPSRLGRTRLRDSSRDLETSLREVMSRSERSEREREELYSKLESLKLSNDAQVTAGAKLEEEKTLAEEKLVSCQLQLQKLERQLEGRDQSLGEREEELERLRREVREEEKRSRAALRELEESRRGREEAEDGERR